VGGGDEEAFSSLFPANMNARPHDQPNECRAEGNLCGDDMLCVFQADGLQNLDWHQGHDGGSEADPSRRGRDILSDGVARIPLPLSVVHERILRGFFNFTDRREAGSSATALRRAAIESGGARTGPIFASFSSQHV
jgi:hypothetical protein